MLQRKILSLDVKEKITLPVLIIGGGISGQYAALMLSKLGFCNVSIVEKASSIDGGRCNSILLNGYHIPPGAMRIPHDPLVDGMLTHLEIFGIKKFYNSNLKSIVLYTNKGSASAVTLDEAISNKIISSDDINNRKWQEELQRISTMFDSGKAWKDIITSEELDTRTLKEYLVGKRNWSEGEFNKWSGSPLGDYKCYEGEAFEVVAWELFNDQFLTYKRNSNIDYFGIDNDMFTLDDMSQIPINLASLNQKHGVRTILNSSVEKVTSDNGKLIVSYKNADNTIQETICDYCFDTTVPADELGINIVSSQKVFIDVSFPDNHILASSEGKCYIYGDLKEVLRDEGFGELYILKHINKNRCILMTYSWGSEAKNSLQRKSEDLPIVLLDILSKPISSIGTSNPVFEGLIYNGGIATPVKKAFRMTSKKDSNRGLKFSPVSRLENPYVSELSGRLLLPGFFCENEWVSMGPGFIVTAIATSLKFVLEVYKKTQLF